jgi:hypothetical protein
MERIDSLDSAIGLFIVLAVIGALGLSYVKELFHESKTFLGKFCVVLFSPLLFVFAGALVIIGMALYLVAPASLVAGAYFIYSEEYIYALLAGIALLVSVAYITWVHKN